jgi:hypothetical protein
MCSLKQNGGGAYFQRHRAPQVAQGYTWKL